MKRFLEEIKKKFKMALNNKEFDKIDYKNENRFWDT